jgi:hypothetical protein
MLGFNEKKVMGHLNLQMSINGWTLLVLEDVGFPVGADSHMFSSLSFASYRRVNDGRILGIFVANDAMYMFTWADV